MRNGDTIIPNRQTAIDYDMQARKTEWFGPEVVFGLAYEFVQPGERLLDLGIGSGLSSVPFHKAGLRVYGLDGSSEILEVCAQKGFATDLKQHDLRRLPLPYPDKFFKHVISVSVLNSFQDLGPIFKEVGRITLGEGIFAFTVENQEPGQEDSYLINRVEVTQQANEDSAVRLYRHAQATIAGWLEEAGFVLLKTLKFKAFEYPAEHRDVYFKACVARLS
jgi:predicted TPR repeat methyltransferase